MLTGQASLPGQGQTTDFAVSNRQVRDRWPHFGGLSIMGYSYLACPLQSENHRALSKHCSTVETLHWTVCCFQGIVQSAVEGLMIPTDKSSLPFTCCSLYLPHNPTH